MLMYPLWINCNILDIATKQQTNNLGLTKSVWRRNTVPGFQRFLIACHVYCVVVHHFKQVPKLMGREWKGKVGRKRKNSQTHFFNALP